MTKSLAIAQQPLLYMATSSLFQVESPGERKRNEVTIGWSNVPQIFHTGDTITLEIPPFGSWPFGFVQFHTLSVRSSWLIENSLTVTVKTNQQTETNNCWVTLYSRTTRIHTLWWTSFSSWLHRSLFVVCLSQHVIDSSLLSFKVCRCQMKMRLTGRSLFVDLLVIVSTVLVISKLFPTHGGDNGSVIEAALRDFPALQWVTRAAVVQFPTKHLLLWHTEEFSCRGLKNSTPMSAGGDASVLGHSSTD